MLPRKCYQSARLLAVVQYHCCPKDHGCPVVLQTILCKLIIMVAAPLAGCSWVVPVLLPCCARLPMLHVGVGPSGPAWCHRGIGWQALEGCATSCRQCGTSRVTHALHCISDASANFEAQVMVLFGRVSVRSQVLSTLAKPTGIMQGCDSSGDACFWGENRRGVCCCRALMHT